MRTAASVLVLLAVQAAPPLPSTGSQHQERYAFSERIMGTEFRLVVYAESRSSAHGAAVAAFARGRSLDSLLSDWLTDSAVSRLSLSAGRDTCVPVVPDLFRVLEAAQDVAARTDGAFDVTVGPLTRLWRWAIRRRELPADSSMAAARGRVGYRKMVIDTVRQCVRLLEPGMKIDLGGIAKGFAADEMLAELRRRGLPASLVDAGGDIVAGRAPPGQTGWRIELPSTVEGSLPSHLLLENAALATSGDTYRYLEIDGVRYSHVLDPKSGYGVTMRRIVSVAAPRGMEADALASAISVMGAVGLPLARGPGYGALLQERGPSGSETVHTVGILKNQDGR